MPSWLLLLEQSVHCDLVYSHVCLIACKIQKAKMLVSEMFCHFHASKKRAACRNAKRKLACSVTLSTQIRPYFVGSVGVLVQRHRSANLYENDTRVEEVFK